MRTRLGALAENLIESGWLLALIIVPLYFNVYSHRVFEPDKLAILRTIALLMAACAAILWLENRSDQSSAQDEPLSTPRAWLHFPLIRPTLLLVLVYLVTTALSVVPRISMWGSYQRLQGTLTTVSYITLFLLLLYTLRREAQLRRLITAAILTSLPVALYGLVQHNGIDPLPWGGDVTQRVASTLGNAIFVGAYLVMLIPLTLGRLLEMIRRLQDDLPRRTGWLLIGFVTILLLAQIWAWLSLGFSWALLFGLICAALCLLLGPAFGQPLAPSALVGGYGFVLATQFITVLFSGSRGPQVGLLGGLLLFGLLFAAVRRKRTLILGLTALGIVIGALLVVINLPASPLAAVREVPYVGRLGRVLELDSGTGKVRVLIWQGAVEMLRDDPLRALIGHGPESMYVAYNPYYPAELAQYEARNASPDRSHNETFDALITTGFVGLAAHLALFVGIFYYGYRWLGLLHTRRSHTIFFACAGLGGLGGILVPLLIEGTFRLSGVGLPLGIIMGVAAYVLLQVADREDHEPAVQGWPLLLLISLLAAIAAHWIEISVGIAIAATRTYFWVYAALVLLIGQQMIAPAREETEPVTATRTRRLSRAARRRRQRQDAPPPVVKAIREKRASLGSLVAAALIIALILGTMIWNYTTNPTLERNPLRILATAYTTGAGRQQPEIVSLGMLWVVLSTWAIGALISVAELGIHRKDGQDASQWLSSLGFCGGIAGSIALIYALIHAAGLVPPLNPPGLLGNYYGLLLLIAIGMAGTLYLSIPRPERGWFRSAVSLASPVVLVVAILFASWANLRPIRADMLYKQGLRFDGEGNWQSAAGLYEAAAAAVPTEDYYWLFAGRARLEQAKLTQDPTQRDKAFRTALDRLEQARELNPLNTDHTANLARTYRSWAEHAEDAPLRQARLEEALVYYEQAAALSPQNAQLLNEWGLTYAMLGDEAEARTLYERSLALDEAYSHTYMFLGDLYFEREEWTEMIAWYEQALEIDPRTVFGWSRVAYAYSQIGDVDRAIAANKRILDYAPNDYITLKNLSYLYSSQGQHEEALGYLEQAIPLAPNEERDTLIQLAQQLTQEVETATP